MNEGRDEARGAEEEQGGGAAREPARGVREREVSWRPTPRSMLSSEVPVGGGCAEFPAVEKDPRVPRRVPTPSPTAATSSANSTSSLFFIFFFFPACVPALAGNSEPVGPRAALLLLAYETTVAFRRRAFDSGSRLVIEFASGPIAARERKYVAERTNERTTDRLADRKRRCGDAATTEIHTRTVT